MGPGLSGVRGALGMRCFAICEGWSGPRCSSLFVQWWLLGLSVGLLVIIICCAGALTCRHCHTKDRWALLQYLDEADELELGYCLWAPVGAGWGTHRNTARRLPPD